MGNGSAAKSIRLITPAPRMLIQPIATYGTIAIDPQREPLNINVVSSLMPSLGYRDSRDVDDMYWFARAIERAHGIGATND